MKRITKVITGGDYLLTVYLDNNYRVTIDLKKKLHTVRFSEIRDRQVFEMAATDGKMIYWPGGLSLAISEILELAKK